MAYDIYGNNLRPGHCEVHPSVHEEYPCALCMSESQQRDQNQAQQIQQSIESQMRAEIERLQTKVEQLEGDNARLRDRIKYLKHCGA